MRFFEQENDKGDMPIVRCLTGIRKSLLSSARGRKVPRLTLILVWEKRN